MGLSAWDAYRWSELRGRWGIISLGSKDENAFSQDDLDLLSQIANQISLALDNALAYRRMTFSCRRLEDERDYLQSEFQSQYNFEDIVGQSAAIKHVLEQVAIVAPTDSTVLLIGESGTGKELVARAIHNLSKRRDRTFVRLNCAAVPSGLLESELFGREKGAFTGALAQKRGRIELAHQGSLFLDEIGDIGLELQPKLLRVLQEREFERLGSNRTIKVDTRLIAATHRDLPEMMRKGEFRDDLFYRLNVFPIHIPPLRERRGDIPLLVHYFVANLSRKMRKSIRIIPPNVMNAITSFRWPGNVRELQNFHRTVGDPQPGRDACRPNIRARCFARPTGHGREHAAWHGAGDDSQCVARRGRQTFRLRGCGGAPGAEANHLAAQNGAAWDCEIRLRLITQIDSSRNPGVKHGATRSQQDTRVV